MAKVIIQPAGGRESREHYTKTVQAPVPLAKLRRFLPAPEITALEAAYESDSAPVWGVTPRERRSGQKEWGQMQPGDIVLFTGGKKAYAGGIITYRTHNAALARDLWGTDKKGRTWEYVYCLKDVFDLSIPYTALNMVLGYKKNFVPQGVLVLDPTRSQEMIDSFRLNDYIAPETEVDEVRSVVRESAGEPSVRQGFRLSVEARKAIEDHAVDSATQYCTKQEWKVENVSRTKPYDLHCSRGNEELRVEVKGTTSEGREVLLTPNEVSHARNHHPQVALIVVSNIQLSSDNACSGGELTVLNPWAIDKGHLEPVGYAYTLPHE